MSNNLQRKAFSYCACTDLYRFPKSDPNSSIRLCVYILQKLVGPVVPCTPGVRHPDRSQMFTRRWRILCSERHFGTPLVRICTAPLIRTGTAHLGYVYTTCTKLGDPVVPCTTGVRLPDRSRMFTRPWQTICSERHFRTPPVRICTAPRSRTRTAQLGCVCTNYKKLVEPVVPCTPAIRHPDCSRMFTSHGKQSAVKGTFVHLLYGSVWLP